MAVAMNLPVAYLGVSGLQLSTPTPAKQPFFKTEFCWQMYGDPRLAFKWQ